MVFKIINWSIPILLSQRSRSGFSKLIQSGQHGHVTGRCIHNYVRPMLLALRYRRIIDDKKNPTPKAPRHRNTAIEWNYNAELFAFGKRLNEDIEDSFLRQAFVDKAYATKERLRQEELGLNAEALNLPDNEHMASEGHAILENHLKIILTSEFPKFPQEGIKALLAYLTSDNVLSNISLQIGTKDLIQCVEIPPTEETLARTFRALISAIEKSGGQERAKLFILDFVMTYLCDKDVNEIWDVQNPWRMLSDILSARGDTFEPRLLREAGKNTLLSVFVVGLYTAEKKLIGTGIGETVEIAQEMAARDALSLIFETRWPRPSFKFIKERNSSPKSSIPKAVPVMPQLKARI